MNELLKYLIKNFSFLYDDLCFRFVDSRSDADQFDGNAYVTLESKDIRIMFIRDRSQIMVDIQGVRTKRAKNWYGLDVVLELVTGKAKQSGVLTAKNVQMFSESVAALPDFFSKENIEMTEQKLGNLEKERAKRLFG
jgi:hypothetical protein